jgi:hypothetical protein
MKSKMQFNIYKSKKDVFKYLSFMVYYTVQYKLWFSPCRGFRHFVIRRSVVFAVFKYYFLWHLELPLLPLENQVEMVIIFNCYLKKH